MQTTVVFGATSAIAIAFCRRLVEESETKRQFLLVARDSKKLEIVAEDLEARGAAKSLLGLADFSRPGSFRDLLHQINDLDVGLVLFAHGILTQQSLASDYRYFLNAYQINFLSIVELTLGIKAKLSNAQVIFISSVAGDRGRGSNFAYGCAKAALSSFAEGLRAELLAQNTHVLVVKPGIVATPMTYHLHKGVAPDVVARDMIKAVKHRWHTLYSPWYWQAVMFVIRMIPPGLFKRWNI